MVRAGGSMDISDVLKDADAVLDAFYPGQFGATAIAGKGIQSLARFLAGVLLQSFKFYENIMTSSIVMECPLLSIATGRPYGMLKF